MKYEIKNGGITENGHTVFLEDIVVRLNRIDYLERINKEASRIRVNVKDQFTEVVDAPPSEISILRTKLWADAFICEMPNTDSEDWQNECANIADLAVAEFDKRFKI